MKLNDVDFRQRMIIPEKSENQTKHSWVSFYNREAKSLPKEYCARADFESVRTYNKSFALTMDHTIVRGDPYCSCVYYDTRITKELTHPSKEFFDSIWPLADRE